MYWSGNYIAAKELNSLLKEANVTLTQVLEAEDILEECKANNKTLIQFLTRPEIRAELITLIIEEPPKDVDLASQYRHANIACEVLTSHISTLSDCLSSDTVQMHRLCDFVNCEPPLNPLLASYFSKTVEMLLNRGPSQDWYLYHIVCLRVLDFFKSRREFLPNLLRHLATSAIADTFKYLLRLNDLFKKVVVEWLEEHGAAEALVQVVCCTYRPEPVELTASQAAARAARLDNSLGGRPNGPAAAGDEAAWSAAERRAVLARCAGAAALLQDVLAAAAYCREAASSWLGARLRALARALLGGVFTGPAAVRAPALAHASRLMLLLLQDPEDGSASPDSELELVAAQHMPLLHQALLQDPAAGGVGAARLGVAALLARLAASARPDLVTAFVSLGTLEAALALFLRHPDNNFLHARVAALLLAAADNGYLPHMVLECDILSKLLDAFEESENLPAGAARRGYMGHVTSLLRSLCPAARSVPLPAPLAARLAAVAPRLAALGDRLDTPLGGSYPFEKMVVENMGDALPDNYEHAEAAAADGEGDAPDTMEPHEYAGAEASFMELACQRFGDDMWEDSDGPDWNDNVREEQPDDEPCDEQRGERSGERRGERSVERRGGTPEPPPELTSEVPSPWDAAPGALDAAAEGWAQFDAADPFAEDTPFWCYWESGEPSSREGAAPASQSSQLAGRLLTAMSAMSPADIAGLLPPEPARQDTTELQEPATPPCEYPLPKQMEISEDFEDDEPSGAHGSTSGDRGVCAATAKLSLDPTIADIQNNNSCSFETFSDLVEEQTPDEPRAVPLEKQSGSVKKQSDSVEKQSGPVVKQSGPVEKQSGPVVKQIGSVDKQSDQVENESEPVKKQSSQVEKQNDKVEKQNDKVEKQNDPVEEQSNPVKKQSGSVEKQSGSVEKQSVPVENQSGPVEKQSVAVEKQSDPVEKQSVAVEKQSVPVDKRSDSVEKQSEPTSAEPPSGPAPTPR